MEYLDEQIIAAMNKYKSENTGNIYSGVYIKEKFYEFQKQTLFKDQFSIYLPKSFIDMPLEMAKKKYPSEQRPQIIKMNKNGAINFAFSLLQIPVNGTQISEAKDTIKNIIKKVQPANIFYEDNTEPLGESFLGWFDYKSYAIDNQIYNIVYLTTIGNKVLHGVFNCIFDDINIWRATALQVIRSINDITGEEDNERCDYKS